MGGHGWPKGLQVDAGSGQLPMSSQQHRSLGVKVHWGFAD